MTISRFLTGGNCAALIAVLPALAEAGAWAREEGAIFLSFGGNLALSEGAERPVYHDPTIYLEYGLTERLTIGLDAFSADRGEAGAIFAFGRLPMGDTGGVTRWAFSFGAGAVLIPNGEIEPSVRLGLHYGRGYDRGWLALDGEAVQSLSSDRLQTKLDGTWGHRFAEDWTSVLSAQIGTGLEGDFYAKVSPSVVWSATDRISLRAGAVHALTGDRGTGVMAQIWLEF